MSTTNAEFFNAAQHTTVIGSTFINVGGNFNILSGGTSVQISSLPALRLPSSLFTGRSSYLETLEKHFCNTHKQRKYFLLHGMGGIGKTQICLQFIEQNKNWFSDVFWIDASSEATIDLRLKQIEKAKNISSESGLDWYSQESSWLMVFDNADGGYKTVEKFLPPGGSGNILITSRNKDIMRITLKSNSMEVLGMDEKEAILLLLKSATAEDSSEENTLASQIVSELGYIPLAIDQAGAYIQACDIGLNDYLDLYYNQSKELMSDSLFEGASNYGRSTYGTWELSMKEIESRAAKNSGPESVAAQSAMTLYNYFAFLHHDNITEDMFKNAAENYKERDLEKEKGLGLPLLVVFLDAKELFLTEGGHWNRLQFQDGIQVLMSFALIKSSNKIYSIHPLVHSWSRDRISLVNVSATYHKTAALLSCSIEPDPNNDNYALCMQIVPHFKACHVYASKLKLEIMKFDDECDRFAFLSHRVGNLMEARQLYTNLMEARIANLGVDHPETLWSMHNLSSIHWKLGRMEEAEKLQLQVLDGRKTKLGADHLDTLAVMHNLAMTYWSQGKKKKAEKLQLKVLDGWIKKLGADHPATFWSMHNLAVIYYEQGRIGEAEQLELQVLDRRKAKLGDDHPDTLLSIYNLAATYYDKGRLEEAEKLQLQVLDGRKAKLGADHPDTLAIMHHLAMTYKNQGRLKEAEKLQMEVVIGRKSKLGTDHPDTFWSIHNLAVIYSCQGRMKESEQLELQVLDRRKAKLGNDHPDTLSSIFNLAATYYDKGRWEEAEKLQLQVLDGRKAKLGADHPDTLAIMHHLAMTYKNQSRLEEAEKLQIQVVVGRKLRLGMDHPATLWSAHNLAAIYFCQGRMEESEQLNLQVLNGRRARLGADHPSTLSSIQNLAAVYYDQGKFKEAEKLQLQALDGWKAKHTDHCPDALAIMHHLAMTYNSQGRSEEAEKLQMEVVAGRKLKLGTDHPDTFWSMHNLAVMYCSQDRMEEAEKLQLQILEGRKVSLGADHPDTISSMHDLATLYSVQGRIEEKKKLGLHMLNENEHPEPAANHADFQTHRLKAAYQTWKQDDRWKRLKSWVYYLNPLHGRQGKNLDRVTRK